MTMASMLRASPAGLRTCVPAHCKRVRLVVRAEAPANSSVQLGTALSNVSSNGYGSNGAYVAAPPQPITVNVPEAIPGVLSPAANYQNLVKAGLKKTQLSVPELFVSGILAGCYIGLGGFLYMSVLGGLQSLVPTVPSIVKLIGGLIFPVGLTMVVLSGTELYTGNTAVVPMSVYEKQATWGGMMKNWFWSYFGNFVGSLGVAAAVVATGLLVGNPVPVTVATYKATLPFWTTVIRATLCNWLVCMAVWNASSATTLSGKMLGLWGPIATFVTIGLEHSVANMFFIPLGIAMGAKVTFAQFLTNNLLPVTIGNTLGGFVFVGTAFAFIHGSLGKKPTPAAA